MKTRYLVYDVFTSQPFSGNQLAICLNAEKIDPGRYQSIAREFNFSETVFLLPPSMVGHTARVRIFTPTQEIPFGGHPLIGTAVALSDMGGGPDLTFELGIGPIKARAREGRASFLTSQPLNELAYPDPELIARVLGLAETQIILDEHPPIMASLGLPFTFTRLVDLAALSNCQIDIAAMREGAGRYPGSLDFAQFAYVIDDNEKDLIHARMFAPLDNIPEDPATGSASATLAALFFKLRGKKQVFTIHQGKDMGRDSLISLKATHSGVEVSGAATKVMEGWLYI